MPLIIDRSIDIDAPAARVWQVLTDLPRYPEWNPFCIECESTLRPGDPIVMRVNLIGRPQRQKEWITEFEDGAGFAYRMSPLPFGALSSRRSHELVPLSDGTTRYHSRFQLSGWLHPLVSALLGSRLRRGFGAMTDAVACRSEQATNQ